MKKLVLMIAVVLGMAITANAKGSFSRDESLLPLAARTTISSNFKAKISLIKAEKMLGTITEYEVILTDGSEISFDKNGNWQEIDVPKGKAVPNGFVPKSITDYVKKTHSGQKVVSIDKDKGGYSIELSNGIDMKFDKSGNFIKYAD